MRSFMTYILVVIGLNVLGLWTLGALGFGDFTLTFGPVKPVKVVPSCEAPKVIMELMSA